MTRSSRKKGAHREPLHRAARRQPSRLPRRDGTGGRQEFRRAAAGKGVLAQRTPAAGLICHSDRGSQYASADYQALLAGADALPSMSRRGNCYDNAPVESFFATMKRELIHRTSFATREEARLAVFEWITVWYNRQRRHLLLGYISPEQFEKQYSQPEPMRMAA